MALTPGTRLGPYEILRPAGAGGMGEVYQASDTRLDRIVAIKVLPEATLNDPGRRQRQEREARLISSLSHPNICALYDIGHQDGVDYLVMELLEGETLADRLAKGPLPPESALRHAVDIAAALDAAHRRGVIHRDLKPDNVMLTRSGAKLLDFGLARSETGPSIAASALSTDPTSTRPLTAEGAIVGTLPYMAPEQLEGKAADARTDLFAFGVVVYEMMTGRRPFQGKSQASLIASILASEPPPLASFQPLAPAPLERAVRRCLAKDPDERWQSARDLLIELQWIQKADPGAGVAAARPTSRRVREAVWMALALLLAAATLFLALERPRGGAENASPIRASILPPDKSVFRFGGINSGPMEISPDGRKLVFSARTPEGRDLLWVRALDAAGPRPLEGTEGASFPFWSPDSRFIGFFSDAKLKKIDMNGGPAQTLCNASIGRGGSWNADGTIVFAPDISDSIYRVPANGGEPAAVTQLDPARHQMNQRWPQFLPDGRHFLYFARSSSGEETGTYAASLDSGEQTLVMPGQANVIYASGYLLFMRETALMAQPFDPQRLELTGEARILAEPVSVNGSVQKTIASASAGGILAFQSGTFAGGFHVAWFDRSGKPLGSFFEATIYIFPKLSPDGKRLAVQVTDLRNGNSDLWIYDVARGVRTRFTFEPSIETYPTWSPDGKQLAFASNRDGRFHLYVKTSDGVGGQETLVNEPDADARPVSWSPDARYIAFMRRQVKSPTRNDIWILPLFGDRKPFPFLQTEFEESLAEFSPDGRFVAYVSNESGRNEIYATPFPRGGGKWQVSATGGTTPRWRRDGREIFYIAPDNRLMAAAVTRQGDRLDVGEVRPLFQAAMISAPASPFDVAPDGQRFVVVTESQNQSAEPVTLLVNWPATLPSR